RDNHGRFLAGSCHFFPSTHDAEAAELLACRRALILVRELNVQKVILETDSLVVSKIRNEQWDFSVHGQLVQDVKVL
uniref:RNase H type-1 domain-containing protein n=1 Tax=Triticum urartu TaxID=4572 RepID=A0A8R7QHR9_TRIUA